MNIIESYPYFYPAWEYGGITRVVFDVSKELVNRGHKVTVITTDALDKKNRIKRVALRQNIYGIDTYYFKNFNNFLAYKFNLSLPFGLIFKIDKVVKNCDVIHLHGGRSFQSIILYAYAKKYKIPYIVQAHGSVLPLFEKQGIKKIFDILWGNKILIDASKLIAVSKVEKEQYLNRGIAEKNIEIIPNGIDVSEYATLPERGKFLKRYGIASDIKIILYLGRLHKRKGLDFLITAFSEILNQYQNVKLIIAGPDDGFRDTLIKQIKELKIDVKVLITGPLTKDEKLEAFIDADVLVYPGIFEIFGLVPFEAIMCGTPVIVCDDCGCGEIIRETDCGYLVKFGNVRDLQEKMVFALENSEYNNKLVENGTRYIRYNLAWEKVGESVEYLYRNSILGKYVN